MEPVPTDPELLLALDELVAAIDEFRSAYEAWAAAGDGDASPLSALLAKAESRLDAARAALERFESARS